MTLPLRVLHLEDTEATRRVVETAFKLKPAYNMHYEGYESIDEIKERLRVNYYHLLLLDIRLDDSNIQDRRGMEFLEWLYRNRLVVGPEVYTPVYVAMLSSYGTTDLIRKAMGRFDVIDFLDKNTVLNVTTIADTIYELLTGALQINRTLTVDWDLNNLDPSHYLYEKGEKIQLENPVGEFTDLMCRLYADQERVRLSLADDIPDMDTVFHLTARYGKKTDPRCDDLYVELVDMTNHQAAPNLLNLLPPEKAHDGKFASTVHMRGLALPEEPAE